MDVVRQGSKPWNPSRLVVVCVWKMLLIFWTLFFGLPKTKHDTKNMIRALSTTATRRLLSTRAAPRLAHQAAATLPKSETTRMCGRKFHGLKLLGLGALGYGAYTYSAGNQGMDRIKVLEERVQALEALPKQ